MVTVNRDLVNLWVGHVGRTPEVGVCSQALYSYSYLENLLYVS